MSFAAVSLPRARVSRLTSATTCWGRGDVSSAGWGPAPGLPTPVFIHPAQCWVIRKCNIAVTSSPKTSSLSNLTCQRHPSRRRSRQTNARRPEGAGMVTGGAAAACTGCLAHLGGVRERSEHQRSLSLSIPGHLPAQKGPGLAHGKVAEGCAMCRLRRRRLGPSPGQRRWLCRAVGGKTLR